MLNYKNKIPHKLLISNIMLAGIFTNNIYAQAKDNSLDTYGQVAGLLVLLGILIMFILILVLIGEKYKDTGAAPKKSPVFAKLKQRLTKAVPIEKESEILLEDDFDGIKELDNTVPPWFNYLFYSTIIFAVGYMLVFHVFHIKPLMLDEYVSELKAAEIQREELIKTGALINENTVTLLTDGISLANGKAIFTTNCVPCHGPDAGGTVGPNLTDDYWIHGGGIKNIFTTIKNGVPAKGMISWGPLLNPKKIQEVASYIISLHGTNPQNGKPPEGSKYEGTDSTTSKTDSVKTNTGKIDSVKTKPVKTDSTKVKIIKTDSVKKDIKK
jgi:cytochrome c oxidase cbb3-type subunit III